MGVSVTPVGCNEELLTFMDPDTSHWLLPVQYRVRDNSIFISCLKRELHLCIDEDLTETQRYCIKRYYFDGKNRVAIAAEIGVQSSAVSKYMKKAEHCIRERLGLYMNMYQRIERSILSVYPS